MDLLPYARERRLEEKKTASEKRFDVWFSEATRVKVSTSGWSTGGDSLATARDRGSASQRRRRHYVYNRRQEFCTAGRLGTAVPASVCLLKSAFSVQKSLSVLRLRIETSRTRRCELRFEDAPLAKLLLVHELHSYLLEPIIWL